MIIGSAKGGVTLPNENNSTVGLGAAPSPPTFPIAGTHGYTFGGTGALNVIQEQEHGTETTGTNKADLLANNTRGSNAQTSSIIVCMGGNDGGTYYNVIQEYSIGTTDNSTDKANLVSTPNQSWTHCYSSTHGYTMGGDDGSDSRTSDIEEYEFNTTVNAVNKSNLSTALGVNGGGTDGTYSYSYCGYTGSNINNIEEYELGTGTTAVNVADATEAKRAPATTQNTILLISNAGINDAENFTNVIEEFTMQSTTNATDKADLLAVNYAMSATQSTTHGYPAGGGGGGAVINQYEFNTTVNAVQKGNLISSTSNSFAGGSGTP